MYGEAFTGINLNILQVIPAALYTNNPLSDIKCKKLNMGATFDLLF